jgi:type IV pilus assembly protein PilB
MAFTNEHRLHGIAQVLVIEQLLDKEKALEYQNQALTDRHSLLKYLIENNIFTADILDINAMDKESLPITLVNEKLIKRHQIVPLFQRGNHLFLATDDPSKHSSFKEIQFHTGLHINTVIVEHNKLSVFIEDLLNAQESQELNEYVGDSTDLESLEISSDDEDDFDEDTTTTASEDAPVVKFVNKILVDAIKKGVSDIHFEPYEKNYRIRYRQDGILFDIASPPINLSSRITARIKVMSNLDISERRVPQDGRFKMKLSKTKAIDFRVSTCPTIGGEKVVMRILDPATAKIGIEALGFGKIQEKHFLAAIHKPQGMILVTGPTGSGKTVTLYTALNILNTIERNISTAEDPVEIKVQGINQVNIHPKSGLTFSGTLRAFLRQDPDIIMVGEVRDLETAEIAVKAAQTGHLVLSTLHTNSAAETLTRLVNMGVPTFNIASSVSLIIAQRLGRRLCESCKEQRDDIPKESLLKLGFSPDETDEIIIYKAIGCHLCNKGYKGRVGFFEVMRMSKTIGQLIMSGGNSLDILKVAQSEGMITIFQCGLLKVKEGITSIEEVNRVTVD